MARIVADDEEQRDEDAVRPRERQIERNRQRRYGTDKRREIKREMDAKDFKTFLQRAAAGDECGNILQDCF
jgi:hypothetical protein